MNPTTLLASAPRGLFLDGAFVDSSDSGTLEVINPSDGTVLTEVASATEEDVRRALDLACAAQTEWAATPARERSEILRRAFELITAHTEELTWLQSAELGRALPDSRAEVAYGAEFFRWFAEEAVRVRGDYRHSPAGNARIIVHHQPVGPCLAITPWNFPLAMGARKIVPALAAGCTMIVKPASKTPLTMLYLAKLLQEAGLPDGVLAVVPTASSSRVSALLDDPRLRKLTFTGSTEVGQMLAAQAAQHSLRVSLELGGNAPYIVCEDADLDLAAEAVAVAKMRGAGQVCIAANRFLVHADVREEFVARAVKVMESFRIGRGTDEGVTYGPLSGADQLETVSSLVDDALSRGASRPLGGTLPADLPEGGFYFPTTVLTDIPADAEILSTEIFGPVLAVATFDTDDEAVEMANDTPFGLAAYLFSENLERALSLAERIEAGMVAVNKGALSDPAAPFGGVKESGLGREGGFEGIHEYLEPKFISLPL
ncbi:succinate-semialdehyde dehydrogenase [Corynebacterium humireducens NBRC 106098 = DSM 45392]|uniref:Succinate-semialdehyde dehydrogenase n=1 Tax=Corynebacterium humireducens NBRC 106098 = DSM 45392 TaxID=1223515 RepID=A0A0B5D618_9CORY|nr:NAD-dependent succinate-semialdehyde dehydrogenase [Corynebacterium humireducens]AJE32577.1 succinate-semialdehyde dehydrogenase [Corynebacterium humireducens NBRC 106098 = DSM 45392]